MSDDILKELLWPGAYSLNDIWSPVVHAHFPTCQCRHGIVTIQPRPILQVMRCSDRNVGNGRIVYGRIGCIGIPRAIDKDHPRIGKIVYGVNRSVRLVMITWVVRRLPMTQEEDRNSYHHDNDRYYQESCYSKDDDFLSR